MDFENHLTAERIARELAGLPDTQAWYLVTTPHPDEGAEALTLALEKAGTIFERLTPAHPDELAVPHASTTCLVTGTDTWDAAVWQRLDRLRTSVLSAFPRLIWLAHPDTVGRLIHQAPNVLAFFTPQVALWSEQPVPEEVPRSAAAPFFNGGLPAGSSPPPPGSYADQAAAQPGGVWLLFEDDRLVASADRLVDLRRLPRVEGRTYFVIARDALP